MANPTCMLCRQPGHTPINCPNKKTPVTKTKSAAPDPTQIQPIESLSPYIGNRWVIKARVLDKSQVRTWSNARSQGKLCSMTLIDESGPIRCTIFQEGVDKFYDLLEDGKVFFFSKGQVKNANKKYSSVNCEYELSMDKDAEIWPLHGNDPAAQTLPQQSFNFVPVEALKVKEKGSMVDVLGVLAHAGQPQAITTKAGNSLTKRSIMIADQTAQVEITIWDALAENWDTPEGTVLGVKAARVTEFNGEIGLSLSASSSIDREITGTQAQSISSWYQGVEGKINVPNISRGNAGSSKGPVLYRNTLEEVQRLSLGKGEKPDYISVRGTITHIKSDSMMYDACQTCNKKLIPLNFNSGPYRCEKCDQQFETASARFLLSMMISDGTSQVWVTAFDDVAAQIFSMTASEIKKQSEEDPNFVTTLCSKRMYSQIIARLRVKEDRYGDAGEERMRLTLVGPVRWIGTSPDDASLASTFQYECEVMRKEIEAYFA